MQAEAIAKLQSEISSSDNPAVQAIGQFLLQHLEQNPGDASSILKTDKTIIKSLEAMRKVAEKKKVGNMAVLSDSEGFAIVLNYFKGEESAATDPKKQKNQTAEASAKKDTAKQTEPVKEDTTESEEVDFDFDALLE